MYLASKKFNFFKNNNNIYMGKLRREQIQLYFDGHNI